jgi:hypothetical protein
LVLQVDIIKIIKKNSFYKGILKGFNIPLLPDKISNIYNYIFVRILRVIGGICLILVLSKFYLQFPNYLGKIILLLSVVQTTQILIISLIKIIYGIYNLIKNPKLFEVRNSPINTFATHLAKFIYCAKVGCGITVGTGVAVTTGMAMDAIIEEAGLD